MLRVVDMTERCARYGAPAKRRRLSRMPSGEVDTIGIHRFGIRLANWPAVMDSSEAMAYAFAEHPELGAINRMAYHFTVWADWCLGGARVEQALPLSRRGVHARRWNDRSVAIALMCGPDQFRTEAPPPEQWELTRQLCGALWTCVPTLSRLDGHVPGLHEPPDWPATSHPDKLCPGPMADVVDLQTHVASLRSSLDVAADSLEAYGLIA